MGTLQDELLRVGLAQAKDYADELKIQEAPVELREPARRLSGLKHKWEKLDPAYRLLHVCAWSSAVTLAEKRGCIERLCDALEKAQ